MLIILDNGHGYDTPGKCSPVWKDGTQLKEWKFNRGVVKDIKTRLDNLGIESHILVPEENDISLKERVKRANEIYKNRKDAILVSVHSNAGVKPNQGTGWCVFTSKGKTKSDHYAALFYNSACQYLRGWKIRTDYSDGDPDWESQFYILKNTHCPAVLTENLFMDNEKDCRFLLSPEGHEAIVALHVDAIITINDELNKV